MKRFLVAPLLGMLALLLMTAPASAGLRWCARDPDVVLEGTHVEILVSIPEQYLTLVNGPVSVSFNLPSGVDRQLVFADSGFNGFGYTVGFSTAYQANKTVSQFAVNLTVKVPIKDNTKVPIQVQVIPDKGTAATRLGNDAKTGTSVNFQMYGTP